MAAITAMATPRAILHLSSVPMKRTIRRTRLGIYSIVHKNIIKMQRRRRRHGRRGRIPSPVFIGHDPKARMFKPHPDSNSEPVILEPDELEALRLVDLEGLSQEEAGEKRGISRGTKWRLLQSARRKTTLALPMEGLSESLRTPRQSLKKQSEHSGTEAACAVSTKSY